IRLARMASTPATRSALEPLRALRYNPEFVELGEVVAPPYDVISPADREAYIRRSPHSIARLLLPEAVGQAARLSQDWRRETALAYRDEVRARAGDSPTDLPSDFVLMHLVNMQGEGLVVYPTHRVVPGKRDVTPDLLSHFAVREIEATPLDVERELNTVPAD